MDPKTICVRAPWFRTELKARAHPEWADLPLAVYRPRSRHRELLEVSPSATRAGLTAGMPFKEAQIRCPEAVFVPDDPPKYEQAFLRILGLPVPPASPPRSKPTPHTWRNYPSKCCPCRKKRPRS